MPCVDSHWFIKFLTFCAVRDTFEWAEIEQHLGREVPMSMEWRGQMVYSAKILGAERKLTLSPTAMAYYIHYAELLEVRRSSEQAARHAARAMWVAIVSVVLTLAAVVTQVVTT